MHSPVLFLVFNRPEPTSRVFDVLRRTRPDRLYVAADGPRATRGGEDLRCEETRRIAATVDWPCTVKTLFRSENLGCKKAVSTAIDWFFEQEEEGIILEDDCLPCPTFFRYCEELLERYRANGKVALISGDNFQFGRTYGESSYYFSRYAHIWGWASWRRAWKCYDRDMVGWPGFRNQGGLRRILGERPREIMYWERQFNSVHAGKIDTWDYQLNFAMWANRMVAIVPQHNLVTNIGFGKGATHTTGTSEFAAMTAEDMVFPLRHPPSLDTCTAADDVVGRLMFVQSRLERVGRKLKTVFVNALGRAPWKPV